MVSPHRELLLAVFLVGLWDKHVTGMRRLKPYPISWDSSLQSLFRLLELALGRRGTLLVYQRSEEPPNHITYFEHALSPIREP
jgi:hypothetical protein